MFFGTTIKNEHANLMAEFDMEGGTSILVWPKIIVVPTAIVPSLIIAMEDLRVDVKVEETEATIMEE